MANGQETQIPVWIKNNAKWWYEGKITDSDFVKGVSYLIQNNIIRIQPVHSTNIKENTIPSWIKNNAGWWANGTISNNEFISGIQYLLNAGIFFVTSEQNSTTTNPELQCNNQTTPAGRETCIQQIGYETKIRTSIASSVSYVVGPVTFYYVASDLQSAGNGKSVLTVHFVVEDNTNQEITMSCINHASCNYVLTDGEKEIPYATNTLIYGSLTLTPNVPKFVDWNFYDVFYSDKSYSFLVNEPWGQGSIPLRIK